MSRTVLMVDPGQEFINLVTYILEEYGITTTGTNSLEDALDILNRSQFDLILTEALNQANPFDFDPTFLFRLQEKSSKALFVLCTIYSSIETLRLGEFGITAILRKPVELDTLETTLLRLLNKI